MNPDIGAKPTTPCDEWEGGLFWNGYGRVIVNRKNFKAHRLIMMQEVGHLDSWQFVCHRCDNRKCIRLEHLFVGSAGDNARDMTAKGRHHQTQKTHCPQGHKYNADNTYISPKGERRCRACNRIDDAKHYQSASQQLLKEQTN